MFEQMQSEKLIVFVKAPRPGSDKTRLAETMGAAAACQIYRRMVDSLLKQLAALDSVELRFTPDDAAGEIEPWLQAGWISRPQGSGDLGQRLQRVFVDTFEAGATRAVIIGSDCPEVCADDVRQAWAELQRHDVVI